MGYRKGDRVTHRFQGPSTVLTGQMDRKGYIRIMPDAWRADTPVMTGDGYCADPVLLERIA